MKEFAPEEKCISVGAGVIMKWLQWFPLIKRGSYKDVCPRTVLFISFLRHKIRHCKT